MARKTTPADVLSEAMQAHTDLNMFSLIMTIMDDHCRAGSSSRAQRQINAICRRECQKLLKPIDKARAALS